MRALESTVGLVNAYDHGEFTSMEMTCIDMGMYPRPTGTAPRIARAWWRLMCITELIQTI